MSKYQELIDAGAPELPEGYYYLIHPIKYHGMQVGSIDIDIVKMSTGEKWGKTYRTDASSGLYNNAPAIEHLVQACQQVYNNWHADKTISNNTKVYAYFAGEKLSSTPLT